MSTATVAEFKNLVGGELVDAIDGETRAIVNPADGQVIGRVPEGSQADVERAVAAARSARIGWRDTTPGARMEALLALADTVDRHAGELAALEVANVGKPRSLADEELPICSDELRFFAGAARTMSAPAAGEYSPTHTSFVRREPVGIVGQIAPWNYPQRGHREWIAKSAADSLKRVHLELGGKAPAVVLDDADPAKVAAGLRVASFLNSGQDCTAAARVLATPGIYDALLEELVPATASLRVGDPAEGDAVEMGPVVSAAQQQRVLGFLDRAAGDGAHVLLGGSAGRSSGFFVEPTIVTGAGQDAEIIQSEIFGPVVTVQRVDDEETAIRLANDVPYGLAATRSTTTRGSSTR